MDPATWLCVLFASLATASYGLWCLERFARLRVALAFLSIVCFVAGVVAHGNFVGASFP